jgi:uncharacterized membrane protein
MDLALVIALWFHTLALVIAWGYYGILGRMILPGLERSLGPAALGPALLAIERRALPLVLLSVVLFTVTGSYLLVVDAHYSGLGDFFASTWTTLMLVKHVLVIGFVALGVTVDRLIRGLADASSEETRRSALRRLRLSAEAATGLGALITLLTAAAQVAA